jgi:hypothetical protein
MHESKTTASVLFFNNLKNSRAAISMASKVLSKAYEIGNTPHVVLMGTGLSQPLSYSQSNIKSIDDFLEGRGLLSKTVKRENTHLVVSISDLALLRFRPNADIGELAHVPECIKDVCSVPPKVTELSSPEVESIIGALRRNPPIDFGGDPSNLPALWEEHVVHTQGMKWLSDLWEQSKQEQKKRGTNEAPPMESPFDVLCICMYAKMASMGYRTLESSILDIKKVVSRVPGAVDAGLMDIFPDGDAVYSKSLLDFLSGYLIGDENPWELTTRGHQAAAKARVVIKTVFDHVESLASILERSKLVLALQGLPGSETTPERDEPTLVIHDGAGGRIAKIVAGRVPHKARAEAKGFVVVFDRKEAENLDEWTGRLNKRFLDMLEYGKNPTRENRDDAINALGAFAGLSSSYLQVDNTIDDVTTQHALSRFSNSIVTTYPALSTAHLQRELTIRDNSIKIKSLTSSAAVQSGHSVACTHVTYCKHMSSELWSKQFEISSLAGIDAVSCQNELNAIASSMVNRSDPLGVFVGTVGAVVNYNDRKMRLVGWRRNGDVYDSYLSLVDANCLHLMFADYLTSDRMLRTDVLEYEQQQGPQKMPFFSAETSIVVSSNSMVRGSNELLFRLNTEHMDGWLSSDRSTIENLLTSTKRSFYAESGAFRAFHVMESSNDRISGLSVRWSTTRLHNDTMHTLVSANAVNESVAF